MIVLWLASGVLAKVSGSPPPPPSPPVGFSMWIGDKPVWQKKKEFFIQEAEKHAEKKRVYESEVSRKQEETRGITPAYSPDWAELSVILKRYGEALKPSMTAIDEFLIAQDRAAMKSAMLKLRIQLEDEIIIQMMAEA